MKKTDKLLTKKELKKLEGVFSEWKLDAKQTKCYRTFDFDKQIDGLIFIARTTVNSEILKHYPSVHFTHLKVKMTVTTEEVKGLTKKDISLISRIEHIFTTQNQDKGDKK